MNETQAELVLDWYGDLESRFVDLLSTVPHTEKTKTTFLPAISSIVLEAASLLDTVFRTEYLGPVPSKKQDITAFANYYESKYGLANDVRYFCNTRFATSRGHRAVGY